MASKSSTSEGGTSGKPQVTNGERTAQSVGRKRSISDATKEPPREEKRKLAALTEESEELIEARKELISGWKKRFPKLMFGIGIKRMGVLDRKPFRDACYRKYQSTHDQEEKALQLRALWQSKLADPSWHPFQVVKKNGVAQEILFKGDEQLKELKHDLGKEVYDAVCGALTEIKEYGFGEEELWNYCKRRKAPLKEAISILKIAVDVVDAIKRLKGSG